MNELIFQCDRSIDSFLTAVFLAYEQRVNPFITSQPCLQLAMGAVIKKIEADEQCADRVRAGLYKRLGNQADDFLYAYATELAHTENTIFQYFRLVFCHGRKVLTMLHEPSVIAYNDLCRKAGGEKHRMTGFLRFAEMKNGGFYSAITPDNDILTLLLPHFVDRFNSMKFVIHDTKRQKAAVWDGKSVAIVNAPYVQIDISDQEKLFSAIWKTYFNTVSIKERANPRLQRSFLPKKYRINMLEFD